MRGVRPVLCALLVGVPLGAHAQEDDVAAVASPAATQVEESPDAREYRAALARLEANVTIELRKLENEDLACYRRRDGTLEWERVLQDGALPPQAGEQLPHLPLGLFLRELARTVGTEDRARLEELFRAASLTDLYHRHGLLSLGGRSTAVPFAPRLQRFLGPTFVDQLLRSQTRLAVANLLPQLARGRLHRRTFAISLAGLGLDTRTLRDELVALPWVAKIGGARLANNLGLLSKFGKLGTLTGFLFVAAETVVTVYFADDVEAWARAQFDRAVARQALAHANLRLCQVAFSRQLEPERLREALDEWDLAWGRWRDHLLAWALSEEARLAEALLPFTRQAARLEEARAALLLRAPEHPELMADLTRRYGSLEGWWAARCGEDEALLRTELSRLLAAHAARVEEQLLLVYTPQGPRRRFPGAGPRELAFAASAQRLESFSRPSLTRLETYHDQRDLLEALRVALSGRYGAQHALLEPLEEAVALAQRTEALDRALVAPRPRGLTGGLDAR